VWALFKQKPHRRMIIAFLGLLVTSFILQACATKSEEAYLPKASPDAKYVIILQSDKDQTSFYVDGQFIAKGKRIKVLVNNSPHNITAQPDGYIAKEEHIEPPYRDGFTIEFFFLIEDQLSQPKSKQGTKPK